MSLSIRRFLPIIALALPIADARAAPGAGKAAANEHVRIELIGEKTALVPGNTTWLGLHLLHEPHWHTYWINPGDSGLPTRLSWTLPAGFNAGEIAWPTPKRFAVDGLANFGYDGDVLLPMSLDVPADAVPGSIAHIAVVAKWLVCHEECVPGNATLSIDLPIATHADPGPLAASFAAARSVQPENGVWKAQARVVGNAIEVEVRGADLGDGHGLDAFVEQPKLVANSPPGFSLRGAVPVLTFAKSEYFDAAPAALDLVVTRAGAHAIRVHARLVASDSNSASP